jgi:two-component system sensor histidine kinase CpxA
MYTLFWKIFFTFWATILFIEILTAWVTADLSETELHPILEKQNLEFISSTTAAVSVLTANGLEEFKDWIKEGNNLKGVDDIYVISDNNIEVNGKFLPVNIQAILNRNNNGTPVDHYQPIKHTLTFSTTTPKGSNYLVVSTFAHPPLLRYLFAPQRVMLSVLISGLICYLLARYFTKPLTNLRRSTQKLTQGEFDTTNLQQLRKRKDEFGALAVDFDFMSKRLSKLLESQRQLLRDISHELNSPIARIRVAVELARNRYHAADSAELDRVEKEIERLEFLIRELLTFVKIESTESIPPMDRVDVAQVLGYIVDDAKFERNQPPNKQHILLDCPENISVKANAQLLHRAVDNIVRNACYYSPANATIKISCSREAGKVIITIEDQGPGVPKEMLRKIFQPFVRVSYARESETGGSGIGLAIAKRVIDIHNGTIVATNKADNSGLVVTIALPLYKETLSQQPLNENNDNRLLLTE